MIDSHKNALAAQEPLVVALDFPCCKGTAFLPICRTAKAF
jgi:hypothetical protein